MLSSLSIQNFALIEKLSIDFSTGFSTITGETGAGKSILLGALGLVLGKRADLTSLKQKDLKCVIEARFDITNYNLTHFFESNDLDFENETIIRREILPSGKSRAFVNDSPINLTSLEELGKYLIDIHSQNQTHELSEESMQFKIIDAIANNEPIIIDYKNDLDSYKKEKKILSNLSIAFENSKKEQDYNTFVLEELLAAKLISGEQEILESSLSALTNVGLIGENLDKIIALANDEQFGISNLLKDAKQSIQKIATFSDNYQSISERLNSVLIEFEDIISETNANLETIQNDPEQLALTTQKLQTIYNLQQKHQVKTVDALLEIQNNLDGQLQTAGNLEADIASLETKIAALVEDLDKKANIISNNRDKAIPVLSQKLIQILELLGMPNAQFDIVLNLEEQYFDNGKNKLQFLFSANKGSDFGLLKKVASGGEMSRIMLATKAILSGFSNLPTIIFDEIDTGVSGEIANKMAQIMKKMSQKMQVLSITHLPQIASKGEVQFKVFKTTADNQTQTELKLLNDEERIKEIAEMLSGANPTESAITHAKALLML